MVVAKTNKKEPEPRRDPEPGELKGRRFGRVLTKLGKLTREQVHEALAAAKGWRSDMSVAVTRAGGGLHVSVSHCDHPTIGVGRSLDPVDAQARNGITHFSPQGMTPKPGSVNRTESAKSDNRPPDPVDSYSLRSGYFEERVRA